MNDPVYTKAACPKRIFSDSFNNVNSKVGSACETENGDVKDGISVNPVGENCEVNLNTVSMVRRDRVSYNPISVDGGVSLNTVPKSIDLGGNDTGNSGTITKEIEIGDGINGSSQRCHNVDATGELINSGEPSDVMSIMNLLNRNGESDNRWFNESVMFGTNTEVGDNLHVRLF